MRPFVNLEIFRSGEDFSATGERAGEWFFSSVNSYVVYQFVFCLERFSVSGTVLPEASVVGLLGSTDVFDRQVSDDFVHCREEFTARFTGLWGILVDPQASVFLFDRRAHVTEESSGSMRIHTHVLHAVSSVWIVMIVLQVGRMEVVRATR